MAVFKCKMCGGTLEFEQGATVGVCDSCGTKQTLPKTNDEAVANLFNRATYLRLKAEFDKAAEIFEKIIDEDNSNAEAHWGLVLCKYGIEYVEDPTTHKRVPTCHRTQYESIMTDADYLAALENADNAQQNVYAAQALEISNVQKGILAIVKAEKPFDVFICYKETDATGQRTPDSALANDIYFQLTKEGLKVFYAAITLEDKLGQEYEPYIFAALNSAKVMLVVGTRPEYFEAVWVRNEWSRFLKIMNNDRSRLLIPCYRDMDAYGLPEEFAHLQAQDMAKIGFVNDLVRGIKKVVGGPQPQAVPERITVTTGGINTTALLKRAFMFLEDGAWEEANTYCERVLDQEPENAQAYLGKLLAELQVKSVDDLKNAREPFYERGSAVKAIRFDPSLEKPLKAANDIVFERTELERKTAAYAQAMELKKTAMTEYEYKEASKLFAQARGFRDADKQSQECLKHAETARKINTYERAISLTDATIVSNKEAIELFESIIDWKDSRERIEERQRKIDELNRMLRKVDKQVNSSGCLAPLLITIAALAIVGFIVYWISTNT